MRYSRRKHVNVHDRGLQSSAPMFWPLPVTAAGIAAVGFFCHMRLCERASPWSHLLLCRCRPQVAVRVGGDWPPLQRPCLIVRLPGHRRLVPLCVSRLLSQLWPLNFAWETIPPVYYVSAFRGRVWFGLGCLPAMVGCEHHANFESARSQRLPLSSIDVCHWRDVRHGHSFARRNSHQLPNKIACESCAWSRSQSRNLGVGAC